MVVLQEEVVLLDERPRELWFSTLGPLHVGERDSKILHVLVVGFQSLIM